MFGFPTSEEITELFDAGFSSSLTGGNNIKRVTVEDDHELEFILNSVLGALILELQSSSKSVVGGSRNQIVYYFLKLTERVRIYSFHFMSFTVILSKIFIRRYQFSGSKETTRLLLTFTISVSSRSFDSLKSSVSSIKSLPNLSLQRKQRPIKFIRTDMHFGFSATG